VPRRFRCEPRLGMGLFPGHERGNTEIWRARSATRGPSPCSTGRAWRRTSRSISRRMDPHLVQLPRKPGRSAERSAAARERSRARRRPEGGRDAPAARPHELQYGAHGPARVAVPEEIRFAGPGGKELQGWILAPPGRDGRGSTRASCTSTAGRPPSTGGRSSTSSRCSRPRGTSSSTAIRGRHRVLGEAPECDRQQVGHARLRRPHGLHRSVLQKARYLDRERLAWPAAPTVAS